MEYFCGDILVLSYFVGDIQTCHATSDAYEK